MNQASLRAPPGMRSASSNRPPPTSSIHATRSSGNPTAPSLTTSDDARLVRRPVLLAQHALVQLPGGKSGQLVHEVHAARALEVRQVCPTKLDQHSLERLVTDDPVD